MTDPGSKNPIQLGACFDRSRFENPLPTVQLNRFHDSNSGPANRNLEYLSLNSLSVKVVTGCLQQSLSSQNWTPEKQSKPNRRISQRSEMLLGRALSALDFTPATRNVPIVRNHAESCGISPRRPSLSLNCECPFA